MLIAAGANGMRERLLFTFGCRARHRGYPKLPPSIAKLKRGNYILTTRVLNCHGSRTPRQPDEYSASRRSFSAYRGSRNSANQDIIDLSQVVSGAGYTAQLLAFGTITLDSRVEIDGKINCGNITSNHTNFKDPDDGYLCN